MLPVFLLFIAHLIGFAASCVNRIDALAQIQLLQQEVAQGAQEPNFVSVICRALEGSGAKERGEQSHGRHAGRGGAQGQQGPHRITEEFLAGDP